MSRWLPILLLLLFGGCASVPSTQEERAAGEPAEQREGPLQPGSAVEHNVDNRAVAMLWEQAENARRENRLDDAVKALERGLRLAPDDPVLWSRLAEIRLRQKSYAVAENLASKSNALAGQRRLLRYRNWLLIAEARRRRGDDAGAEQAQAEAERLRSGS